MISRFSARRATSDGSLLEEVGSSLDDVSWTVFPDAPADTPAVPPPVVAEINLSALENLP